MFILPVLVLRSSVTHYQCPRTGKISNISILPWFSKCLKAIRIQTSSVDLDVRRRDYLGWVKIPIHCPKTIWTSISLLRNKHGYFEDSDLAEVLFRATEARAGKPGCTTIPSWAREQEVRKIEQARKANVCTLNEFRKHLGLERRSSYEFISSHAWSGP